MRIMADAAEAHPTEPNETPADAAETPTEPKERETPQNNKKGRRVMKAYTVEFKIHVIDEFRKGQNSK